jgi:hypothetical protein
MNVLVAWNVCDELCTGHSPTDSQAHNTSVRVLTYQGTEVQGEVKASVVILKRIWGP